MSQQSNNNSSKQKQLLLSERIKTLEEKVANQENELLERDSFLQSVLDMFPQSVFWKNKESVYLGANKHFLEAAGLSFSNEINGKTDFDLPLAEHAEIYRADDREVMQSGEPKLGIIEPFYHADEGERWLETNKMPIIDLNGEVTGVFGHFYDITSRVHDEQQIKQQLETIEATIDGIGIVKEDVYCYVNPACVELFGYENASEMLGKPWQNFYVEEEQKLFKKEILPSIEKDGSWRGEVKAKRKDGSIFYQGISLTLAEEGQLIFVLRDISELKNAQDKIIELALHDELTGLPNRRLLTKRIDLAIKKYKRDNKKGYAILFFDLDRFKIINDSLGHTVGDKLLKIVAERLCKNKRETDLVARLGGDEFVMLLEDIQNYEDVAKIARLIIKNFKRKEIIDGHKICTSVSIGIVIGHQNYKDSVDVLRDADIAMYQAKNKKANSYKFFNDHMHHKALTRLTIETDLHEAINANQLVVHYQPIINLDSNHLVGCEALVRWNHPTKGIIQPAEFISIAEESGLISDLDKWVVNEACKQLGNWQVKFSEFMPLNLNINISAQELRDQKLSTYIENTLAKYKLNGEQLCIEITESADKGIKISIDDFGIGYSSLSYLHKLPVHNLKIDRSFISAMSSENNNYKVTNTILTLSKQLGLNAIAEGIETLDQLELLKTLGCKYGQGYLYAKPMSAEDFESCMFISKEISFAQSA